MNDSWNIYPQVFNDDPIEKTHEDAYSCGTTNHSGPGNAYGSISKEAWSAFADNTRYFDCKDFVPSICAIQVGNMDNVGDPSTTPQYVDGTIMHGHTDSSQRYPTPPYSMSSMSTVTASNASSPGFEYRCPDHHDLLLSQILGQDMNSPPLVLERSFLSRDTSDSPVLPHYSPNPYPTSEASQPPFLVGAGESPETPSNEFMTPTVHSPNISRSSCETLQGFTPPQPLLSLEEGDEKPIVEHGARPTQGDILGVQRNAKGRLECPRPHCGKSYTAKHNLQGHINRKHLGKMTFYICEYCGRNFTGSRAHKRHMRNKNVCPKSLFARDAVSKARNFPRGISL